MEQPESIVFCWSGGKDSALALYELLRDRRYSVVALLTTCNQDVQRISMHGVRIELAQAQAEAIGLPLEVVYVPANGSNEAYEAAMGAKLAELKERGVTAVAFGDINLADLRAWREERLAALGLRAMFPLWDRDTRELIGEFLDLGFRTVVCCVNDAYLGEEAVGVTIDRAFLAALPAGVDPCGENGEFHTFAYAGPLFDRAVSFAVGEKVYRPLEVAEPTIAGRGFWYCDLVPC